MATMDDDDVEIPSLGDACDQITDHSYRPDDLTLERWDRMLRTPHICAESKDQIARIIRIRAATVSVAALMLRYCPCSISLDRALTALHDSQLQAITAIQANE